MILQFNNIIATHIHTPSHFSDYKDATHDVHVQNARKNELRILTSR